MHGIVDYVALWYIMLLVQSIIHDYFKDWHFHVTYGALIYRTLLQYRTMVPYCVRKKPMLPTCSYYQQNNVTLCYVTDDEI